MSKEGSRFLPAFGVSEPFTCKVEGFEIETGDAVLDEVIFEIELSFWQRVWNFVRGKGWRQYERLELDASKFSYTKIPGMTLE